MPHESGKVTDSREARVQLAGGKTVECLVDTGFDGALLLPRPLVKRLGLSVVGRLVFQVAGGARITAEVVLAEVNWLGARSIFEVIVGDGADSLLGTEMLAGARLVIDYAKQTLLIETGNEAGEA